MFTENFCFLMVPIEIVGDLIEGKTALDAQRHAGEF